MCRIKYIHIIDEWKENRISKYEPWFLINVNILTVVLLFLKMLPRGELYIDSVHVIALYYLLDNFTII